MCGVSITPSKTVTKVSNVMNATVRDITQLCTRDLPHGTPRPTCKRASWGRESLLWRQSVFQVHQGLRWTLEREKKSCLVKIFASDQGEKANKDYVDLDDQSNTSSLRTELFNLFDIKGHSSTYSVNTCAGVVEMVRRRVHGFQV